MEERRKEKIMKTRRELLNEIRSELDFWYLVLKKENVLSDKELVALINIDKGINNDSIDFTKIANKLIRGRGE